MTALQIIVIVLAIIGALTVIGAVALVCCVIFSPAFDEHGEIHECVGCRGHQLGECPGCKWNPDYWDRSRYIGPSAYELRKRRKRR